MRNLVMACLAVFCLSVMNADEGRAAAPMAKVGCTFQGWIVSSTGNTPFNGVSQYTFQYLTATTGNVTSGEQVVNDGTNVCTYNVVGGSSSPFTLSSNETITATLTFTPATGNPAGCTATTFVGHQQEVLTTTGSYAIQTDPGIVNSGICTPQ